MINFFNYFPLKLRRQFNEFSEWDLTPTDIRLDLDLYAVALTKLKVMIAQSARIFSFVQKWDAHDISSYIIPLYLGTHNCFYPNLFSATDMILLNVQ